MTLQNKFDAFVELLSKEDTDPNQPESGRLPIVEAVKTRELKYVDTLIQYGALANGRDPATKAAAIQYAFQGALVDVSKHTVYVWTVFLKVKISDVCIL